MLKTGDPIIDVSHWQKNIDWPRVVSAGVQGAYIKASELLTPDPRFEENWRYSHAAGVRRGAYMFYRPDWGMMRQVTVFTSLLLQVGPGELPPAIDFETDPRIGPFGVQTARRDLGEALQMVIDVCGQVILYTRASALNEMLEWNRLQPPAWAGKVGLWVAHYTRVRPQPFMPKPWTKYFMWQYANDGRIPGIQTRCDLNVFGSWAALAASTSSASGQTEAPNA